MRVRQIALVAEHLEPLREHFFTLLGLSADFADPGVAEFGLHNSVMTIGDTFLEIVAPTMPNTTAGRLLERRGGDGGYMVILQVDEIASFHEHVDALKVRKVWQVDSPEAKAFHMHPRDVGAAIVSLDQMTPPESWRWAGPNWHERQAKNVHRISGVTVQGAEPQLLAKRWAEVLKLDANGAQLKCDDTTIDFVAATDGRGDGVCAIRFGGCDLTALRAGADKLGLDWHEDSVNLGGVQLQFGA